MRVSRRRSSAPPRPMIARPSTASGIAGALSVLVDGRLCTPATGAVCTPWTLLGGSWFDPPGSSTTGVTAPTALLGGVWKPATAWLPPPVDPVVSVEPPLVPLPLVPLLLPLLLLPLTAPLLPPVAPVLPLVPHSTQKTFCFSPPG